MIIVRSFLSHPQKRYSFFSFDGTFNDKGSCGCRINQNRQIYLGRGINIGYGTRYSFAKNYIYVSGAEFVSSKENCIRACKDQSWCKSVNLITEYGTKTCILNHFDDGEKLSTSDPGSNALKKFNPSFAIVRNCALDPKVNSNCFKSGAFITAPYSYSKSFDQCKNDCQSSSKCQVRTLLKSKISF